MQRIVILISRKNKSGFKRFLVSAKTVRLFDGIWWNSDGGILCSHVGKKERATITRLSFNRPLGFILGVRAKN